MAGIPHLWRPLSRGFTTTLGPPDTHVGAGMALAGGPQGHQEAPPQIPAGGQAGRRVPALPWDAPTHSAQAPGGAGPGTAAPLSPHSVGAAGLGAQRKQQVRACWGRASRQRRGHTDTERLPPPGVHVY